MLGGTGINIFIFFLLAGCRGLLDGLENQGGQDYWFTILCTLGSMTLESYRFKNTALVFLKPTLTLLSKTLNAFMPNRLPI